MLVEVMVSAPEQPASFDAFVTARSAALWRSAWLLTGDAHRAEDLVQTALAKTYPHFTRVGPGFEAYVRTAMFRTYVSWWRRRWTGELPGEVDTRPSADPDVALREDVRRALAALPRQQRAVVVLTYFDDLSGAQAAQVLGVSVGTVFLVSHSMGSIRDTCERTIWIHRGELRMDGPTEEVVDTYENSRR